MSDEQTNIPDLPTEKLRLEIEELKVKIDDQKKSKVWDNYVKPIIPVAVTLIIGIWGSILTSNYNSAQLENTKRKNSSDSTVAQTGNSAQSDHCFPRQSDHQKLTGNLEEKMYRVFG